MQINIVIIILAAELDAHSLTMYVPAGKVATGYYIYFVK